MLRGLLFYGGQRHMHVTMVQQTSCLAAELAGQHQAWDALCPWFVTHTTCMHIRAASLREQAR